MLEIEIIVAVVGGMCVAVPSVIATITSNRKSTAMHELETKELKESVANLTKKVEELNGMVQRIALLEQDNERIWKEIDKLEVKK